MIIFYQKLYIIVFYKNFSLVLNFEFFFNFKIEF